MTRDALRCAAPALVVAVLVLVPFLDKAFTIDDTLFLRQAEQLASDPLHPTAFEMVWSEHDAPLRMSTIMPSGPVMAYLLVPCVRFAGREWIAHAIGLFFFGIAIVACAGIALRLDCTAEAARAATLLLAATPAALAMASTAMPDVVAMALGALGIERLLASRDERRAHQALAAAVSLSLAALARPQLLLLLGVGALCLPRDLFDRRRWREVPAAAWLALLVAPLLVLGVVFATRDPAATSTALVGAAQTFSSAANLARNVAAFATHWTLAFPLALPWAVLRWRELLGNRVLSVATLLLGVALGFSNVLDHSWLAAAGAALGVAVLSDVFSDAWRRRDSTQLLLGVWLLLALPIAPYLHLPAKYLLASAPAAAILVARALGSAGPGFGRAFLATTVAAGLVLGILILRADALLAGLGRRAAVELIAPNVAAGRSVWFAGHWGFQWYAEKAGARPLTLTPPYPRPGDLVVSSARALGDVIDAFPARVLLETLEDRAPGGRIMSAELGAGFYSNYWGPLPWAWGDDPVDRFDLWRIE